MKHTQVITSKARKPPIVTPATDKSIYGVYELITGFRVGRNVISLVCTLIFAGRGRGGFCNQILSIDTWSRFYFIFFNE